MDLPSITYDPEVNAFYIRVSEQKPIKTFPIGEGKYVDISESGMLVGLEIILPISTPQEVIDAILGLKEEKEKVVKMLQ